MKSIKQTIFKKRYKLFIASSLKDKKIGMNRFKKSPKNCGMLFLYNEEIPDRKFTLEKTPFSLIVIFLNEKNEIVHIEKGSAKQKKLITGPYPSSKVIEIPA